MDAGILVTGLALVACLFAGERWYLKGALFAAWTTGVLVSGAYMATVVLTQALLDFGIAGVALAVTLHNPMRIDARVVGFISMATMPAHFIMSATHGNWDWTLYAAYCNAGFVLQCLTVGGWLDGVGRGISRFVSRLRPVYLFRVRGR